MNVRDVETAERFIRAALSSPKKIPLLIAEDVIHGLNNLPGSSREACSF